MTPATIAVNRLGPKRMKMGIRKTNGGIVWPASRNGLITRSTMRLRPIQTPTTTARTTTIAVATSTDVSVTIAKFQRSR